MGRLIGLLVVALIAILAYRLFLGKIGSSGTAMPQSTVEVVGVKNDLLAIAQAERIYQAQHGAYASLNELSSSGGLAMKKTGRDGYTYEVETSADSFRVLARCTSSPAQPCTSYQIDPTMAIQPLP